MTGNLRLLAQLFLVLCVAAVTFGKNARLKTVATGATQFDLVDGAVDVQTALASCGNRGLLRPTDANVRSLQTRKLDKLWVSSSRTQRKAGGGVDLLDNNRGVVMTSLFGPQFYSKPYTAGCNNAPKE